MKIKNDLLKLAGMSLITMSSQVYALSFETENVTGEFNSTVGIGTGIRTQSPSCDLVISGASGKGAPSGCLSATSGLGDSGDLNYKKGDAFTTYLKGTHELILNMPSDFSFMARGTWIRDFSATHTSGISSGTGAQSGLSQDASDDLSFKTRLLDFWVAKSFNIGNQRAKVKVGNQVVNWGESLFLGGGINSVNAVDAQRQATPGTQIKETLLASPMIDFTTGLGSGASLEGYYQFGWEKTYLPPAASYWSTSTLLGKGNTSYGAIERDAKDSGQWGLALRWKPGSAPVNLAAYVINYHDKLPQLIMDQSPTWEYQQDRKLFGVSLNMPAGDWAIGSELSYRPDDAVSLNPNLGCTSRNGKCWVDLEKYQLNVNGIYALTPSNSRPFLNFVRADAGNFLVELGASYYPGLKKEYDGIPVSAGYAGWGQETDASASAVSAGTALSAGVAMDFSVTYDGTLIPGWQVTPEIYYYQGISGRTPNISAQYMEDAKTMNLALTFIRTPGTWQVTANYAMFAGGTSLDNPYRDRDYVGFSVSRNF